jgi:hypothetical protein
LEKAIRERGLPADVETAARGVSAVLDPLVRQLQAALETGKSQAAVSLPVGQPESDPARVRDASIQLSKLLSEFDPAAVEFVEANHLALRPLFPTDAWTEFEKLVQGYAFSDAQARLDEALRRKEGI